MIGAVSFVSAVFSAPAEAAFMFGSTIRNAFVVASMLGWTGAACVELENAADAGAVAFNQAQTMKDLRQLLIPRLRNAETDILRGKTGQEAAQKNKLHFAVVYVDDNASAEAVVPMHQRVEQRFADGFLGIVLFIRADDTLDGRDGSVAQRQIIDRLFKLLEDRAAKP